MKNPVTLILLCILPLAGLCQEQIPFGMFSKAETDMKDCPFDPEADAVVLLHEAYADHDDQYQLITKHHVRVKILKEAGTRHADIKIPFYSKDGFEFVNLEKATIYNPDPAGGIRFEEVNRKNVFKKEVNKYYSEMVFTFPSVKVGSILEYSYQSTMKHYGGLESWEFQQSIPVLKSKYSVVILPSYEFAYRIQKNNELQVKVDRNPSAGRVAFEMNNIPGLRNEPYMDSRKDYLQMVRFQLAGKNSDYKQKYMTTWQEVIREMSLHQSFGSQIGKNLSGSEEFISATKLDPSEISRLKKVFQFVKENMGWNGFNGLYSGDGIKQAWSKKTGTSSEVNLVLTTLLREAGIEAYPMLVSERSHGRVNTDYPFVDQFNTVYVYAMAGGKKFYLDATDKYTPPHIIPSGILNTTALVINRKSGGLIQIKDEAFSYRHFINVTGRVDPEGNINGHAFISSLDYARSGKLSAYRDNPAGFIRSLSNNSTSIDSFELKNEDIDTLPLQQKFNFTSASNTTGKYTLIPATFFSDLTGNPFLSDIRFSNVNFGYRQTHVMNIQLELPEGTVLDALPTPVRMTNEEKSVIFSRHIFYDEKLRKLNSRVSVELTKSEFNADEYVALKEFYKKMFNYLNEQVVLKQN